MDSATANVRVAEELFGALGDRDPDRLAKVLAEDVRWHIGGSHALAGDHEGRTEVILFVGRLLSETDGHAKLHIHDIMASADHVVALVRWTVGADAIPTHVIYVFHVGKETIEEGWVLSPDEEEIARAFGAQRRRGRSRFGRSGAAGRSLREKRGGSVSDHPNAKLVMRGFDAFAAGDMETMAEVLAPDIVWHVAGNNILSGDYSGLPAVLELFGRFVSETEGQISNDVHDITASEDHAVALVRAGITRKGKSLEYDSLFVFHVSGGQATECWPITADQAALDEILSG